MLSVLGILMLRIGLTDEHLRYVQPWMRWGVLATGGFLLLFSAVYLWADEDEHHDHEHEHGREHRAPLSAWLLLVPSLVVALVAPQALGAYVAERRANPAPATPIAYFEPLAATDPLPMKVVDFVSRAQLDTDQALRGRDVTLTGFVSREGDRWFVTRIGINCCAADAFAWKVEVADAEAPPEQSWVRVTGQWKAVTPDPTAPPPTPVLTAAEVVGIDAPRNEYE
jgi:uncharacterized repeat protein (TIGR03943 family)